MEIIHSSNKNNMESQGKSMCVIRTEHFVPPSHPAYIITSNFTSPHLVALQEQFDKNYIAMGMQTSKKTLAKIPEMPTDKFFIIVDDCNGPVMLQGQFLMISKKVVNYPLSNNIKRVIEQFNSYIGLGHLQVSQQTKLVNMKTEHQTKCQKSQNIRINTENKLVTNGLNQAKSQMHSQISEVKKSKIEFKQLSSMKEQLKVSQGYFFIYDNRKDVAQFKSMVQQLKLRYSASKEIIVVNRIDQYNHWCAASKLTQHIILMTQNSYTQLSAYFDSYHSMAVFADGSQKIKFKNYQNIVLFTSCREQIYIFIEKFIQKKVENRTKSMIKSQPNENLENKKQRKAELSPQLCQKNDNYGKQVNPKTTKTNPKQSQNQQIKQKQHLPDKKSNFSPHKIPIFQKQNQIDPQKHQNNFSSLSHPNEQPKKSRIQFVKISDLKPSNISQTKKPQKSNLSKQKPNTLKTPQNQKHSQPVTCSNNDYHQIDKSNQEPTYQLQVNPKKSNKKITRVKSQRRLSSSSKNSQKSQYQGLNVGAGLQKLESIPITSNLKPQTNNGHTRVLSGCLPTQRSEVKPSKHMRSNTQQKNDPSKVFQSFPSFVIQEEGNTNSIGHSINLMLQPQNENHLLYNINLVPESLYPNRVVLQEDKINVPKQSNQGVPKLNKKHNQTKPDQLDVQNQNPLIGTPKFRQAENKNNKKQNDQQLKKETQQIVQIFGSMIIKKPIDQKDQKSFEFQNSQNTTIKICNLHFSHQIQSNSYKKYVRQINKIPPTSEQIQSNSDVFDYGAIQIQSKNTKINTRQKQPVLQNNIRNQNKQMIRIEPIHKENFGNGQPIRQTDKQMFNQVAKSKSKNNCLLPKSLLEEEITKSQVKNQEQSIECEQREQKILKKLQCDSDNLKFGTNKISINKQQPVQYSFEDQHKQLQKDPYGLPLKINKRRKHSKVSPLIDQDIDNRKNDPSVGKIYTISRSRSKSTKFYDYLPFSSIAKEKFMQKEPMSQETDSVKSSNSYIPVPRRSRFLRMVSLERQNQKHKLALKPLRQDQYSPKSSYLTERLSKIRSRSESIIKLNKKQKSDQRKVIQGKAKPKQQIFNIDQLPESQNQYFTPSKKNMSSEIKKNKLPNSYYPRQQITDQKKLTQITNKDQPKNNSKIIPLRKTSLNQCTYFEDSFKPITKKKPQNQLKNKTQKTNKLQQLKSDRDQLKSKVLSNQKQLKEINRPQKVIQQKVLKQEINCKNQSNSSQNNIIDCLFQTMILYLIQKSDNSQIYQKILQIKQEKDTLIFYKNDKQLFQQILQSKNVFDIVYIFTPNSTPQTQKIIKNNPHCYQVKVSVQLNAQIKNKIIYLPSLSTLPILTEGLIRYLQCLRKKTNNIKSHINKPCSKNKSSHYFSTIYQPKCCLHKFRPSCQRPAKSPQKSNRCYACGHS